MPRSRSKQPPTERWIALIPAVLRSSLAGKFSVVLLALLIPLAFVGVTVRLGLAHNAEDLLRARRVKELAASSLSLILTQDDVTKEILLDVDRISEAQRKIDAYDENLEVMDRIARLTRSPDLLATLDELRRLDEERLRPLDSAVLEAMSERGPEAAQQLYFSEYQPLRSEYVVLARRLMDQAEVAAQQAEVSLEARNRRSVSQVVLALLAGIGLVAVITLAIARHVTRRLAAVVGVLEEVAKGDLRGHLAVDSDDEIGRIGGALNTAIREIGKALLHARRSATEVQGSSKGIARAAALLARTAAEQRKEVGKASSAVNEVTAQVWEIAERARSLRTLVDSAGVTVGEIASMSEQFRQSSESLTERIDDTSRTVAEMKSGVAAVGGAADVLSEGAEVTSQSMLRMAGRMEAVDRIAAESAALSQRMMQRGEEARQRVQKTIEGVTAIRESTRSAERVVQGVGARAAEIGQVLDVIHEVADETKLLALNAAIIAAQAGSGGRAFAVVASEIKALAQRVTEHTKEVEQLIRAVQDESANAIVAMDRGAAGVEGVVELSSEAGEAVDDITRASRESGDRIQRIAREVRDESQAAQQIVELMQRNREAIGAIRAALSDHGESNQVMIDATEFMGEAARQICATALQLVGCTERIRDGIGGVKGASEAVEVALQAQSVSTQSLAEFLERVGGRASENSHSAQLTSDATQQLSEQADALNEQVLRFEL